MTKGLKEALESALRENPDDLAAHMAYGDLLHEQGDPRGEFIQVQLALENPSLSPRRREELQGREKELLAKHREEWLGPMHALFDRSGRSQGEADQTFGMRYVRFDDYRYRFSRGWLESLEFDRVNGEVFDALLKCPTLGLVRDFAVTRAYSGEFEASWLQRLPFLGALRRFRLGPENNCHIRGKGIASVLAKMPRLEELYLYAHLVETREVFALPMPNLRTLHVYHVKEYPLEVLGENPTLRNLLHLSCWPHGHDGDDEAYVTADSFSRMAWSPHLKGLCHLEIYLSTIGDEGVRALVESGMLRQLRMLDLWSGTITDVGARLLAASPDVKGLTKLRLSQNFLTDAGVEALKATGVPLEAENMYDPADLDDPRHERDYLYEGDSE